ncbi:MAG: sugar ABC transporter permease [Pseudomonadota bacterium]|nr:sugar ABC transporter permease [Pseudomonadota bacterium]
MNPSRNQTRTLSNFQFALALTLPVLIFLVLLMAYPLGYAVWLSFHDIQFVFGKMRVDYVGFDNYVAVYRSPEFWHAVWISMRFAIESVILTILIGLGLALVMNNRVGRSRFMRTLILLPWAVSLYGAGTMWFYLTSGQTGVVTAVSYWLGFDRPINLMSASTVVEILALGNAWNLAPLVAFFLLANLTTIPRRLYDLAAIDCLSPWARFIHVTLPPLRFTLFVFTSIAMVLSLRLFDFIDIMSRGGPGDSSTVLPYLLYDISFKQLSLGYGAAMSFYLLALIIVSTLALYFAWGRREEAV